MAKAKHVSWTSAPSVFFADDWLGVGQNRDRQKPIESHGFPGPNNLPSHSPMCSSSTRARAAIHAQWSLRSPFVPCERTIVAPRPQRSLSHAGSITGRRERPRPAARGTRARSGWSHEKSPQGGACLLRLQQRSGPAGDCASRAAGLLEKSEGVNDGPFRPGVVRRLRAPTNQKVRH